MKKIWGYWYTLIFIVVAGLAQFGVLDGFKYSGAIDGVPLHVQVAILIYFWHLVNRRAKI
jgi:hypothetical protein